MQVSSHAIGAGNCTDGEKLSDSLSGNAHAPQLDKNTTVNIKIRQPQSLAALGICGVWKIQEVKWFSRLFKRFSAERNQEIAASGQVNSATLIKLRLTSCAENRCENTAHWQRYRRFIDRTYINTNEARMRSEPRNTFDFRSKSSGSTFLEIDLEDSAILLAVLTACDANQDGVSLNLLKPDGGKQRDVYEADRALHTRRPDQAVHMEPALLEL